MAKKVILIADPGIDTAFAVALALHDPELDVLALVPTAGNVSATQARTFSSSRLACWCTGLWGVHSSLCRSNLET